MLTQCLGLRTHAPIYLLDELIVSALDTSGDVGMTGDMFMTKALAADNAGDVDTAYDQLLVDVQIRFAAEPVHLMIVNWNVMAVQNDAEDLEEWPAALTRCSQRFEILYEIWREYTNRNKRQALWGRVAYLRMKRTTFYLTLIGAYRH